MQMSVQVADFYQPKLHLLTPVVSQPTPLPQAPQKKNQEHRSTAALLKKNKNATMPTKVRTWLSSEGSKCRFASLQLVDHLGDVALVDRPRVFGRTHCSRLLLNQLGKLCSSTGTYKHANM